MKISDVIINISNDILRLCYPLKGHIGLSYLAQAMLLTGVRLLLLSANKNSVHIAEAEWPKIGSDVMAEINAIINKKLKVLGVPCTDVNLGADIETLGDEPPMFSGN